MLRLLGEASDLSNQLAHLDQYLAGVERDQGRAQEEDQAASADIEWLEASRTELSDQLAMRQLELESATELRARVEQDLAARRAELAQARRQLDELRAECSRIRARRDSLEEILSHRAYTTESVKRLFTAIEQGEATGLKPAGVLADFVDVETAWEKAVEEFLHEELEYIVVENWEQAEAGIHLVRAGVDGRATFLVHPNGDTAARLPFPEPEQDSGLVGPLGNVLRLTNGMAAPAMEFLPRLARCYLAADRSAAQRLATEYPYLHFLLEDGVCYHGRTVSGGKKSSGGPLALKRELREAKALAQSRQKELTETAAAIEALEGEIEDLESELERLRRLQQEQEKEKLALDHEMRKLAEDLARARARLSVARLELERLGRERQASEEERGRKRQALEALERARQEHEQASAAAREELEALKTEAGRVAEEHATLRAEVAGLEERRRAVDAALARLASQAAEMAARRNEIAAELERLEAERARLTAGNQVLESRLAGLTESLAGAQLEVERLSEEETRLRAELAALEEALRELRIRLQEAQERRAQIQVELVERQAELKFLDETSRKEVGAPVAGLLAEAGETPLDDEALAAADQRCQEIRARIEALGPVNPQALEEYHEAQQRYDFLNTQRQDLLDSIRDTEKVVREIDVESRRRFSEAFAAINAHFRELFATLFGGGSGEMRLTDEENVAESGIEIVASPPGKRLQNVLLLSGGEKALTALALLMAIFKFQPSPFCILDEVDAPLDDPNIQRYMRLLNEMASQTQFILITHARRTMEAAQTLYGVTMQEPGVSKLVSVRLDESPAPPPPQAAAVPELARA
jgi:chromosome segregation protein